MAEEIRITAKDAQHVGFCLVPGVRDFCAIHGFDFRDFIRNGIGISEVSGIDDALLDKAINRARERTNG